MRLEILFYSVLVLAPITAYLCLSNKTGRYRPLVRGTGALLLMLLLGVVLRKKDRQLPPNHYTHFVAPEAYYKGKIRQVFSKRSHTQLVVSLRQMSSKQDHLQEVSGKALLLIPHQKRATLPPSGSTIAFRADLEPIGGAMNPLAFDPSEYWGQKKVSHQAWIDPEVILSLRPPSFYSLSHLRRLVLTKLKVLLPAEDQLGIGAALVIGDKSLLDRSTKTAYSESGAIHVLAVSGLHVGLIYGCCYWLFNGFCLLWKGFNRVKLPLLLLCLIAYALFTGAAPSVCRSVLMLSCWILAKALHKTPSVMNVISASAFILLCLQPSLLFNLGFQLSYAAVLGIIFLYPLILKWWSPGNKVLDYAWKLTGVSVAAQLGTLPLSLYYFHQFPVYFALSSLLIIPLITLILITALSALFLSWQGQIFEWLGKALGFMIDCCNRLTSFIQQLPQAVIRDIWPDPLEVVLYYALLVCVVQLLNKMTLRAGTGLFFFLFLLAAYQIYQQENRARRDYFVLYHSRKFVMADWLEGGKLYSLQEEGVEKEMHYASRSWRSFLGKKPAGIQRLREEWEQQDTALYWTFQSEQYLLAGPASRPTPANYSKNRKTILIVQPENPHVDRWLRLPNVELLVLLDRYGWWKWKEQAVQKDIPYWSMAEKGALLKCYR